MKKQRGNAGLTAIMVVLVVSIASMFSANADKQQRYVEDCQRSGGKIEIQTKYTDTKVGTGTAIRESMDVKVCVKAKS